MKNFKVIDSLVENTPSELFEILSRIKSEGGRGLIIGGWVRDHFFGRDSKDIDVEVFGLDVDKLISVISPFGKVDTVGSAFGVIKLTTEENDFDFSLPRRDSKVGEGHKGIKVEVDHTLSIVEAARRRDFTMNALSFDPLTKEIFDPFNGVRDIEKKTLEVIDPSTFIEDPLRVLRGVQFCGRFDLFPWGSFLGLSTLMQSRDEFSKLSGERVWEEWRKLLCKSEKPSQGLIVLLKSNWIINFPELHLWETEQDPEWHPEGNVWNHTLCVVDEAARICRRDKIEGDDRMLVMLGALCHDLGKASTTILKNGRWSAPKHDSAGEEPTRTLLKRMGCKSPKLINKVVGLVREHMFHVSLSEASESIAKRLVKRLNEHGITRAQLAVVIEADHSGRPPLAKGMPEIAREVLEWDIPETIEPIIKGRHLLEAGIKPGPEMGDICRKAMEGQLDGAFSDVEGGLSFLGL